LQQLGNTPARQIEWILGPYTGTALEPGALDAFLRMKGVPAGDDIVRLQWRAGKWPGYLEIEMESGRILRSQKVYYNFLIPFFITQASLQTMDFGNEFADLAAGDAWSPKFEKEALGHSVFTARTQRAKELIEHLTETAVIECTEVDPLEASEMHGHMIDFKKRGGYIRNKWRRCLGLFATEWGYMPEPLPIGRQIVEAIIVAIFFCGRLQAARWLVCRLPEALVGRLFDTTRKVWKGISKPTKRRGLRELTMRVHKNADG
jgi:coenzyme F420 hydrogenase subunit beta